jgi:hypothetical protein
MPKQRQAHTLVYTRVCAVSEFQPTPMGYAKQQGTNFGNITVSRSDTLFLRLVVPKRIPNINVGLYNLSPYRCFSQERE